MPGSILMLVPYVSARVTLVLNCSLCALMSTWCQSGNLDTFESVQRDAEVTNNLQILTEMECCFCWLIDLSGQL